MIFLFTWLHFRNVAFDIWILQLNRKTFSQRLSANVKRQLGRQSVVIQIHRRSVFSVYWINRALHGSRDLDFIGMNVLEVSRLPLTPILRSLFLMSSNLHVTWLYHIAISKGLLLGLLTSIQSSLRASEWCIYVIFFRINIATPLKPLSHWGRTLLRSFPI